MNGQRSRASAGPDPDEPQPPSELAFRVHARIRDAHRMCDPATCALRTVWVEDVQEIFDAIEVES